MNDYIRLHRVELSAQKALAERIATNEADVVKNLCESNSIVQLLLAGFRGNIDHVRIVYRHLIALVDQLLDNVTADEAGTAGYEGFRHMML